MLITRSPQWKAVKGAKTVSKKCPRCGNSVEFQLMYDTEFWLFGLIRKKIHVLKCPICIHIESVKRDMVPFFSES